MLILITVLIASTASHRVTESFEDLPPEAFNTTTLFPVANRTTGTKPGTADIRPDTNGSRPDRPGNATDSERSADRSKVDATVWKIEAAFGESKLDEKDSDKDKKEASPSASPPLDNKTRNSSEDFRPSPHLETYVEDDSLDIFPTRATIGDFRPLKKPPSGFISFPKDYKTSFHHSPKDAFKNQFPYKIESSILTRAKSPWRPSDPLDSKPTMEVPMRIPAGSLYEAPDAFKEKPGSDDEDLGLTFNDLKDNSLDLKKRVNPLKNLLRLLTAFIPVGLIISALTPNIVTVQSTGPGLDSGYSPHLYRRSDSGTISELAAISEPCRRRLLCELRSEDYYEENPRSRRRQCHRLPCEEPEALARMLRWLLSHRRAEKRGQHYT